MPQTLRLPVVSLSVAALLLASGWAAPPPADAPLRDKGLRRQGAYYALTAEADFSKKVNALRAMQTELANATMRQAALEQQAAQQEQYAKSLLMQRVNLNQQLQQSQGLSVQQHNMLVARINELSDQINLLQDPDRHKNSKDLANRVAGLRDAFVQRTLALRTLADETSRSYETLAADPDVQAALAQLNKAGKTKFTLGPTRGFQTNVKVLEKIEKSILTETIPLRSDNGIFWVNAVLNDKFSKPMVLDTGAGIVLIPGKMAQEIGLDPSQSAATIQLQVADGRTLQGKRMTVKSIRVGKFLVENVECAVLPPEMADAPPLLGGTFLKHFNYKVDPDQGKLTLMEVATPGAAKPKAATPKSTRRGRR